MKLMTPTYSVVATLALSVSALNAAIVLSDNMDYGNSDLSGAALSGVSDWIDGSNRLIYRNGENFDYSTSGSSGYTNDGGNVSTGSLERNDNIDNRFFERDYSDGTITGEVWLSAVINVTTTGAATGEAIGISLNSTGGLTLGGDLLGVGYDGASLLPVWYDQSEVLVSNPRLFESNYDNGKVLSAGTVLLVAKLNIGAGDDSFSMWLFDGDDSFGTTEASLGTANLTSTTADFGNALDQIQVGGVDGFDSNFDQIRISDLSGDNGLSEILTGTAIPEPSSTALMGLGCIALILRRRRD